MKLCFGTIAMLLVFSMAPGAQADPVLECGSQTDNQVELGLCLAEVEKTVDTAMDLALGFAMAAAKDLDDITERDVAVPALKTGQAAWSAYRDRHCEYVGATYGGGSGTGKAIRGCRIELARTRTDILMNFTR